MVIQAVNPPLRRPRSPVPAPPAVRCRRARLRVLARRSAIVVVLVVAEPRLKFGVHVVVAADPLGLGLVRLVYLAHRGQRLDHPLGQPREGLDPEMPHERSEGAVVLLGVVFVVLDQGDGVLDHSYGAVDFLVKRVPLRPLDDDGVRCLSVLSRLVLAPADPSTG